MTTELALAAEFFGGMFITALVPWFQERRSHAPRAPATPARRATPLGTLAMASARRCPGRTIRAVDPAPPRTIDTTHQEAP